MSTKSDSAGLLQFIQIIIALLIIICQAYAFKRDFIWTKLVKSKGMMRICPYIVQELDPSVHEMIAEHLAHSDHLQFDQHGKLGAKGVQLTKSEVRLYEENIMRTSVAEKVALALSSLEFMILTVHLIAACWSTNYSYKTNWTALVQGFTVFSSGFAATLVAISANHFSQGLELLAIKFPICSHFLACSVNEQDFQHILENEEFTQINITTVRRRTQPMAMCQEYKVKMACTIMSAITVGLAFIIICNAMDLKTLYEEEDVDEEERARRENFNFNANKSVRVKAIRSRNQIERTESLPENRKSTPETEEP